MIFFDPIKCLVGAGCFAGLCAMLFGGCSTGVAAFAVVTKVEEGGAAHRWVVRSQPASRGDSEWIIMKIYVTNDNNMAAVCNIGVGKGR